MSSTFAENIKAHLRAKQFAPFLDSVTVDLPNGESTALRLSNITLFPEALFQVYRHSCIVEMTGAGITEEGCGEADTELLAMEKAVSEALERLLFRVLKGSRFGTRTTNGWAAHLNPKAAERAALLELLERDAALVHWFKQEPMIEVEPKSFPDRVQKWAARWLPGTPFPRLRILLSHAGHIPTISTALVDAQGFGVISHSASESMESAMLKALSETARLARLALGNEHISTSRRLFIEQGDPAPTTPHDQAVAYAYHHPIPDWIYGKQTSHRMAQRLWRTHQERFRKNPIAYEYVPIMDAPIAAGFCKSSQVQNLFFGSTRAALTRGLLNRKRIDQPEERINLLPHFVA